MRGSDLTMLNCLLHRSRCSSTKEYHSTRQTATFHGWLLSGQERTMIACATTGRIFTDTICPQIHCVYMCVCVSERDRERETSRCESTTHRHNNMSATINNIHVGRRKGLRHLSFSCRNANEYGGIQACLPQCKNKLRHKKEIAA